MKNKKPRKVYRPRPVRRGPDSECPECFGYPYHESWCARLRGE